MIEKILNSIGYYKQNEVRNLEEKPFTQDEILSMYVSSLDNLDTDFDQEVLQKMFIQLKSVDGFISWLNYVMEVDVKNHYSATTDVQRSHIRGAQSRLMDIKKRCIVNPKPVTTRISGVRYG